jgi:hypothetical protein
MKKIAFWRTVGAAYGYLFTELMRFLVLAGGWFVAVAITVIVMILLMIASPIAGLALGMIIFLAVMIGAVFGFSVAWHRAILLDEPPRFLPRFGRREWRFLGYSLVITLAYLGVTTVGGVLLAAVAAGVAQASRPLAVIVGIALFCGIIVADFYVIRLMLALPAAAVDEPSDLLGNAWRRGKGNGIRLGFGSFLCMLPTGIVQVIVQFAVAPPLWMRGVAFEGAAPPSVPAQMVSAILYVVLYFVQMALIVGFLSFSYLQLAEGEAAQNA